MPCGFYLYSYVICLETWNGKPSTIVLLPQNCFNYPEPFVVTYEVTDCFSISWKKARILNCVGILNMQIVLVRMAIFTILILPIHEHRSCFYILISSPISFCSVLKFLLYKSFTPVAITSPRGHCGR